MSFDDFDSSDYHHDSFHKENSADVYSSPSIAEPVERTTALQRPELKNSTTLPVINLERNAWADDADDEDFGRERDMEMTFA